MRPPRILLCLLALLAAPPARAEGGAAEPDRLLAIGGFLLLVAALGFGLGRYAWTLRRDFVQLLATAPREPGAITDRLVIFRDAPAGMPEGSIRAVLAVAIVLLALPALVLAPALGLGSTGELGTVLGGVLGFYFGTRSAGGDAEAARRQAGQSLREAEAARHARDLAGQEAAEARAAREAAEAEADATAAARARAAGETAGRLAALAARAGEAIAAARAIAALLPVGPASAAVLDEAGQAAAAIEAALADPDEARIAAAAEAAAALLRRAGEGTELAGTLGGALEALRDAAGAIGAVRAAVADPTPERLAGAMAETARVAAGRGDGGLGAALAPALGVLGSAMRLPALAGTFAAASPAGLAAGLMLGAWQAAQLGRAHYQRWMARVLDRPVSRDLFPAGEWDGEAARALIAEVPALAAALADRIGPDAPQETAARALAELLEPEAGARLFAACPEAFASEVEAEEAVAALRRLALEAELDRTDRAPVALGGGVALAQARLREDLDRLREGGAGGAIDGIALLADGVIAARPAVAGEAAPLDVPALLRRAVEAAAPQGRALERPPVILAPLEEIS